MNLSNLLDQVKSLIKKESYEAAIHILQKRINCDNKTRENYWYLGLCYLLNGEVEEAQSVWMTLLLQANLDEVDDWTKELTTILTEYFLDALKFKKINQVILMLDVLDLLDEDHKIISTDTNTIDIDSFLKELLENGIWYAQNKQYLEAELYFNSINKISWILDIENQKGIGWYNLAVLYVEQLLFSDAINCIEKAIKYNTFSSQSFYLQGFCYEKNKDYHQAVQSYENALKIEKNNNLDTYISLGYCYIKAGKVQLAIDLLEQAVEAYPSDLRLQRLNQSILPSIYHNDKEIDFYRQRFDNLLSKLIKQTKNINLLNIEQGIQSLQLSSNLFLGYQGRDDLEIQKKYGKFVANIISVAYPQYLQKPTVCQPKKRKIKIGYVSQRLQSMLGILTAGWVRHHSKLDFEIYSYDLSVDISQVILNDFEVHSDFYRKLSIDVDLISKTIQEDSLDILVFIDIGMDPIMMLLGSLRLAPIQCTTWSHPITTGLMSIDYFLSSKLMEPKQGDKHYSEKLIRLPNLGVSVQEPQIPIPTLKRDQLGISTGSIVYLSCQSLSKYLPKYDHIYPSIASRISNAKFIFIELHDNPIANQIFKQRMVKAFKNYHLNSDDFCLILPRASHGYFLELNQIADIGLDTFSWSGGITSLHSIACNLPIVTCPGEFMRGRHTYAILTMLGLTETIAHNEKEYINIAIRLGLDSEWRNLLCSKIKSNKHKIYDDLESVQGLEAFYKQVFLQHLNNRG